LRARQDHLARDTCGGEALERLLYRCLVGVLSNTARRRRPQFDVPDVEQRILSVEQAL
jgi:hypothetical protein